MPPKVTATGSISPNFHEASRSEYLAQYVFSMFGTSVLVPRPEDFGVDLYCTLFSEREGQRVWPVAYYSVQVKSDETALVYSHQKSVEWVVEYPAPLLHCIIDKTGGQVRIYQTFARFGAAVAQALPANLVLVPEGRGADAMGAYGHDPTTGNYLLGVPILNFRIEDLLDDEMFKKLRALLHFWVLRDFENVRRYQMGMRSLWMPVRVVTNEMPEGDMKLGLAYAPGEVRSKAEDMASELLDWLIAPRVNDHDYLGALLGAMMLRHQGSDSAALVHAIEVLRGLVGLDTATGTDPDSHPIAILDKLLAELAGKLQ
jgi:hypothetical protein